jgi:hypothetical protein
VTLLPPRSRAYSFADRIRFFDRFPFHFEINSGVSVCCVDAGMAEPPTDGSYIDAGLKKVDRRTMTHTVRMEALGSQGWRAISCSDAVLGKDVSDPKARQGLSSVIAEQSFSRGSVGFRLPKEVFKEFSCLWPKRTDALLAAFSKEPRLVWFAELKITWPKIEDFLNTSTCVEHSDK